MATPVADVAPAVPAGLARAIVGAQGLFDPFAPWVLALLLVLAASVLWRGVPGSAWPAATRGRLLAAGGLALAWAALAWGLFGGDWPALHALDTWLAAWAHAMPGHPALQWLAVRLSDVGELAVLAVVTLVTAAWLWRRGARGLAAGWLLAVAINSLSVRVLKNLFGRARPSTGGHTGDLVTSGFSFPSGHAAGSLMVVGLLAWLLCRHAAPRWRPVIASGAVVLIAGIAASRVLLGVHYASDVLGGLLWSGALLLLAIAALDAVNSVPNRPPALV